MDIEEPRLKLIFHYEGIEENIILDHSIEWNLENDRLHKK